MIISLKTSIEILGNEANNIYSSAPVPKEGNDKIAIDVTGDRTKTSKCLHIFQQKLDPIAELYKSRTLMFSERSFML